MKLWRLVKQTIVLDNTKDRLTSFGTAVVLFKMYFFNIFVKPGFTVLTSAYLLKNPLDGLQAYDIHAYGFGT